MDTEDEDFLHRLFLRIPKSMSRSDLRDTFLVSTLVLHPQTEEYVDFEFHTISKKIHAFRPENSKKKNCHKSLRFSMWIKINKGHVSVLCTLTFISVVENLHVGEGCQMTFPRLA